MGCIWLELAADQEGERQIGLPECIKHFSPSHRRLLHARRGVAVTALPSAASRPRPPPELAPRCLGRLSARTARTARVWPTAPIRQPRPPAGPRFEGPGADRRAALLAAGRLAGGGGGAPMGRATPSPGVSARREPGPGPVAGAAGGRRGTGVASGLRGGVVGYALRQASQAKHQQRAAGGASSYLRSAHAACAMACHAARCQSCTATRAASHKFPILSHDPALLATHPRSNPVAS